MPNTSHNLSLMEAIKLLKNKEQLPVLSIACLSKTNMKDAVVLFRLLKEKAPRNGLTLAFLFSKNSTPLVTLIADFLQSGMTPENCTINLTGTNISDAEAQILAQAIQSKKCPSRLILNLSFCGLQRNGFSYFLKAFESGNCAPFSTFIFDNNRGMGFDTLLQLFDTNYDAYPIGLQLSFKHCFYYYHSAGFILKSFSKSNPADLRIDLVDDNLPTPISQGIQNAFQQSRELFLSINIIRDSLAKLLISPVIDLLLQYLLTEPSIPSIPRAPFLKLSNFRHDIFGSQPLVTEEPALKKFNPLSDILTNKIRECYRAEYHSTLQTIFQIILDYDEPECTHRYVNSLMSTSERHRLFSTTVSPIVDLTETIKKKFAGLIHVEIYPEHCRLILEFESTAVAQCAKIFINQAHIKFNIHETEIFIEGKVQLALFLNTFCKEKAHLLPSPSPSPSPSPLETLDTSRSCSMM